MIKQPFNLLQSPLKGRVLIEASAGTGKTYTITGLFIRLLLERRLTVDQILVVTFTEAATDELKHRIRERVRDARNALETGAGNDPFLDAVASQYVHDESARQRLNDAIRDFDQAAIFTIHGFCLRMLEAHAFESGSFFNTELVTETFSLVQSVARDYWRQRIYTAGSLFAGFAIQRGFLPDSLSGLSRLPLNHPDFKVIPNIKPPDTRQAEAAFTAAFQEVVLSWPGARDAVTRILCEDPGLNRNRYRKNSIPLLLSQMDRLVLTDGSDITLFPGFEKFAADTLADAVKKGHGPPGHPFFDACQTLLTASDCLADLFENQLLAMKTEFFDYFRSACLKKKIRENIRTFDDLLENLHQALQGPDGAALAKKIGGLYKAALIDEFQDTDPLQYTIFDRIFYQDDTVLYMIGDPKQAIYGFRGADIFAYLAAARAAKHQFTLTENWRSEPELIQAVNTVFGRAAFPFVFSDIVFDTVSYPVSKPAYSELLNTGRSEPPFYLWYMNGEATADPLDTRTPAPPVAKIRAREEIVRAVTWEISRLLSVGRDNSLTLEGRPVAAGDIAVLVRRNTEAIAIQAALSDLCIPSVVYSSGNIFDTHEAWELEIVLQAILFPDNRPALVGALTTDMLGMSGNELAALTGADPCDLDQQAAAFRSYHQTWRNEGFMRMFHRLMREEGILTRLMAFPDGERRNTNITHLTEILHKESLRINNSMEGLLQWLATCRDPKAPRLEEHQLRLESDARAVKLITMHKSKGLEFPIVFCPFCWDGSEPPKNAEGLLFHREGDAQELVYDMTSPPLTEHRELAEKEHLAENLRLLYVALTRARNRCYMVWGRINTASSSAPAYLFHQQDIASPEQAFASAKVRLRTGSDADIYSDLRDLAQSAGPVLQLAPLPCHAATASACNESRKREFMPRRFSGAIDHNWRIISFSSIVHRHYSASELADRDGFAVSPPVMGIKDYGMNAPDIFTFPRGPRAGNCLHEIFEHLDFPDASSIAARELIHQKLKAYGYPDVWEPVIGQMVCDVVDQPLAHGSPDFCLRQISHESRINELEFYFPIRGVRPNALADLFRQHEQDVPGPDTVKQMAQFEERRLDGFMKGFIDLVFRYRKRFYIVDWKSNFLGGDPGDYATEKIRAVMEKEFYFLQYHIYTLALLRYLKSRIKDFDYDAHFGGVFYIFLRGVHPGSTSGTGVYAHKPDSRLIAAMDRFF